jgi:hypothetical protein
LACADKVSLVEFLLKGKAMDNNVPLRVQVAKLNHKVVVTDLDLSNLKVGGNDMFSDCKAKKLYDMLVFVYGLEDAGLMVEELFNIFNSELKYIQYAMRWILRDLLFDYAVRKVIIDAKESKDIGEKFFYRKILLTHIQESAKI